MENAIFKLLEQMNYSMRGSLSGSIDCANRQLAAPLGYNTSR
jgi:hypothetical protein